MTDLGMFWIGLGLCTGGFWIGFGINSGLGQIAAVLSKDKDND